MAAKAQDRRSNTLAVLEYLLDHPKLAREVERELDRLHDEDRSLRRKARQKRSRRARRMAA